MDIAGTSADQGRNNFLGLEGGINMQASTQSAISQAGRNLKQPNRSEDLIYQVVTIASILMVLVSAWVF
jgi:hypothetical protein